MDIRIIQDLLLYFIRRKNIKRNIILRYKMISEIKESKINEGFII